MSDSVSGLLLLGIIGMFIGFGYVCGAFKNSELLENCKKQHNVYECELVAQPKEQSK